MKGGFAMNKEIKIDSSQFDIPEDAKASVVFDRLMRINTVTTEDGLHEAYYERHDKYSERYAIMF